MSFNNTGVTPEALAGRAGVTRGHAYNTLHLMEKRGEVDRGMFHSAGQASRVTTNYIAGGGQTGFLKCKKDTLINFGGTEEEAIRRIKGAVLSHADIIPEMPDWLHVDVEIDDTGVHMHLSTTFNPRRLNRSALYWTTKSQIIHTAENLAMDESDAVASLFFGSDVYDHMIKRQGLVRDGEYRK